MSKRRLGSYGLAALLIVTLALLAWNWSALRARAAVGAGHGARMICSCRYVEGRSMESCQGDKEPGMWIVGLTDDPDTKAVDADVPLLASARARYRSGWGCLFEPAQ